MVTKCWMNVFFADTGTQLTVFSGPKGRPNHLGHALWPWSGMAVLRLSANLLQVKKTICVGQVLNTSCFLGPKDAKPTDVKPPALHVESACARCRNNASNCIDVK